MVCMRLPLTLPMVSATVVIVPEIAVPKLLRLSTSLPAPRLPIPPVPPAPRPPILLNIPIPGIRFNRFPAVPMILVIIGPVKKLNTVGLVSIFLRTPPPKSTVPIVAASAPMSRAAPPTEPAPPPNPKLPNSILPLSANQENTSPITSNGYSNTVNASATFTATVTIPVKPPINIAKGLANGANKLEAKLLRAWFNALNDEVISCCASLIRAASAGIGISFNNAALRSLMLLL